MRHTNCKSGECFECQKDALFDSHYNRANVVYDDFDLTDLKIMAGKAYGYATLNPRLIKIAEVAEKLKDVADRSKDQGGIKVTLKPEEKEALKELKILEEKDKELINFIPNVFSKIKWVVLAVIILLVIALFLRVKGT